MDMTEKEANIWNDGFDNGYNKALEDIEKYFDNLISNGIWNTSPFIVKEYLESISK